MKTLFKFWIDDKQLTRLKALAKQGEHEDPPISVSLLIRRAIEMFLAAEAKKK